MFLFFSILFVNFSWARLFFLLSKQLRECAGHDNAGAKPLNIAEVVAKHVVGVDDWKEFSRGCDDGEEIAVEQADCQEDENLADGAGETPDQALG